MADDERTRSNRNYLAQLEASGEIHLRKSPYESKAATVNRVAEGLQQQKQANLPYNVQAARGHAVSEHGKVHTGRTYKAAAYQAARTVNKIPGARIDSRGNIHVNGQSMTREDIKALARSSPNAHVFIDNKDHALFKHGGIKADSLDELIYEEYDDNYEDFLDDYDTGYKRKS